MGSSSKRKNSKYKIFHFDPLQCVSQKRSQIMGKKYGKIILKRVQHMSKTFFDNRNRLRNIRKSTRSNGIHSFPPNNNYVKTFFKKENPFQIFPLNFKSYFRFIENYILWQIKVGRGFVVMFANSRPCISSRLSSFYLPWEL